MFPEAELRETLRFSGSKINCFPRDQSLSDLLYSQRSHHVQQWLSANIVWFQKISIPPPPPHGRSLEFPRGMGGQREKFPREGGVHVELLSRGCKT